MSKIHPILRSLAYIGLILSVAYSITQKQFDWLFYTGFALLLFGVIYNSITDWKAGEKKFVKIQLLIGGIILAICLILQAIKNV